jgi:hypothetical protein
MRLGDLDERSRAVVVRLKGARDQHRVPVADDFWPLFARYLAEERRSSSDAAWVALRRGRGRPPHLRGVRVLAALHRAQGRSEGDGAHVPAHAGAALVETSGLKVAQEVLGHAHVGTTADAYARVTFPRWSKGWRAPAPSSTRPGRVPAVGWRARCSPSRTTRRRWSSSSGSPTRQPGNRAGERTGGGHAAVSRRPALRQRCARRWGRRCRRAIPNARSEPAADAAGTRGAARAARRPRRTDAAGPLPCVRVRGVAGLGRGHRRPRRHRWTLGVAALVPGARSPPRLAAREPRANRPVDQVAACRRSAARRGRTARPRNRSARLNRRVHPRPGASARGARAASHGQALAGRDRRARPARDPPVRAPRLDALDAALCALRVFNRTRKLGSTRRSRSRRLSPAELVTQSSIPQRFRR